MNPNIRAFYSELRAALVASVILVIVCCGIYPLSVTGIAQAVFPLEANGSLIIDRNGTVRGSALLGQPFTSERYFHPRPSAAGNGYDAANSGGSNLGPTSRKLRDAVRERIATYREENGLNETAPVPADAVTASGSGLDPLISVSNAELQVSRLARARGLSEDKLRDIIRKHTQKRDLGILGDPGVNVLTLNLALDTMNESP